MAIPFKYSLKNFKSRKLTTFITIFGIALVVFVFAAVLMMAYGIEKTLISTGLEDNVLIARKSSNGEISSIIPVDIQDVIRTLPFIAKDNNGNQIISNEPVVVINLEKSDGAVSNITVRGVSPEIQNLRPQVKLKNGNWFKFGTRELIVGSSINSRFEGAKVGDKIKFAGDFWDIVGVFEADGSGFESEFWGDALQLSDAFNRGSSASTVTLKLENAANFNSFKTAFESDIRLKEFEPKIERKFFEEQSELLSNFIRILGIFITIIFSLGATIGASITMYAAVANRTVEIGTLRALGFRRSSILIVFLFESLLISLIGGLIGLAFASFLQFYSISTLNFASFAELQFGFALTPSIAISSLIFAAAMGIIGGFFPSVRAARLKIISALRAI
ncbi:MAG: ABC transporter permease [Ignavibacteriales bacterium]|nr:ABC transporter permease [Ignavibacteriales bacterium]